MDHVRYVLPHIIAHKADFPQEYSDKHGNEDRKEGDNNNIFLAKTLVAEVHQRYVQCIQPMKNFIAMIQAGKITDSDIRNKKVKVRDEQGHEQTIELDPSKHDHPLMKDFIRTLLAPESSFYEDEEADGIRQVVEAAKKKK